MPTVTLTAPTVAALRPAPGRRVEYFDALTTGLTLRITESGHKSWSVCYRVPGSRRLRRYTIGSYPTVSLKDARKQANKRLLQASDGLDPGTAKQTAKDGETVAELAHDYVEKHAKVKKRTWAEDQRVLAKDVLPFWGSRKVTEITRTEVVRLIESIADRGAPIGANRTLAIVRKMFNFGIKKGWLEGNVAALVDKPGVETSRERVLSEPEIRLVWAACGAERPHLAALMRLWLVTAQRAKEIAAIRWADIEGEWLTLPATVTKNGKAHRVYLAPTAREIFAALPRTGALVFPGRDDQRPLSDNKKGAQRITARVLAALQADDQSVKAFDFHGRDLRRTAATNMAAAGVPRADIAKVLNHAEGGPKSTPVYDRYSYDHEKQRALLTWDRVLGRILRGEKAPQKVVRMRGR